MNNSEAILTYYTLKRVAIIILSKASKAKTIEDCDGRREKKKLFKQTQKKTATIVTIN